MLRQSKVQYQNYTSAEHMNKGQIINHSFSAIYTNSTINIKHHFVNGKINGVIQNPTDLKFTWRRLYGDMINLSINSGHQYFCSPLDWDALIQVQIQKHGILIDKSVYGPILLEQKLRKKSLENDTMRYKTWISLNDSSPTSAEIVLFNQSPILFRISVGNRYFQFERGLMQKRGWDIFSCLPDSGILMIQTKNIKDNNQLVDYLQKIKLNTVSNLGNSCQVSKKSNQVGVKDTLSIVFSQRVQRDDFLLKLIEETCDIRKTKSMKRLITQSGNQKTLESYHRLNRKRSNSNQSSKRQEMKGSLIEVLDTQNGLGNRTMQDLFEMIYTPTHSVSHTNQKHSENSKHKSSKVLNFNTNSKHSHNDLRQANSQHRINKFWTDKQSRKDRKDKKDRKCSVSINFKNPEEYDLSPIQFQHQNDPELEALLRNPKKIKQLLCKTRQLKYQNRQLKKQIEHMRQRQQLRRQQASKFRNTKDIKYLKEMIQQINTQMTTRMVNYKQNLSKSSQKPFNFQTISPNKMVKQIPQRKNYNTWTLFRQNNVPNFIRNIPKNKSRDLCYSNRTGDVNINNFININGQNPYCDVPLGPPPLLKFQKGQSQVKIDLSQSNQQQIKFEREISNKQSKNPIVQPKNYANKQYQSNINMFKQSSSHSRKYLKAK